MKKIASFGEFVRETWWAWFTLFGASVLSIALYNAPKTVTLDAKHWECTMAVPSGIETRCTEYNYKGK